MTYNTKLEDTMSRMISTRWKEPKTTNNEIKSPAMGVLIQEGMPIREAAAEIPAYSAHIVPRFASSNPMTAI